jgi:hypothetical protein
MLKDERPIGVLGTLLGFVISPRETARYAFRGETKPYYFGMVALLLLVLITPALWCEVSQNHNMYQMKAVKALSVVYLLSFFFFILIERLLLFIVRVKMDLVGVIAMSCYALAPVAIAILFIYGMNYSANQNSMNVTFVLSGVALEDMDMHMGLLWVTVLRNLAIFRTFYHCIRAVQDLHWFTGFVVTIASLGPLLGAHYIAITVGNLLFPGTLEVYEQVKAYPFALLNV